MIGGKHPAGSPKPCSHFVKNKEHIILFCQRPYTGNKAFRLVNHSRRTLDQGFHNEGADFARMSGNNAFDTFCAKFSVGGVIGAPAMTEKLLIPVPIRRGCFKGLKKKRPGK